MATGATRQTLRRSLRVAASVAVVFCTIGATRAAAFVPSSAHFRIYGDGFNEMSRFATSSSFAVRDCLGAVPDAPGAASSASFKVQIGCIGALPLSLPADDEDGDGVDNGLENGAPNNGDGNGDGIADYEQGNVASLPPAAGYGYVTAIVPADGPCGQLLDVHAVDPRTLGDGDPNWLYPFGMVGFEIDGCPGPVPITMYYHGGSLPFAVYRKFGHIAPDWVSPPQFYTLPNVTFGTAMVGAEIVRTASFSLTDNQIGDDSPVTLLIVDPSGPARQVPSMVPVVSPAGLFLAIAALSGVAVYGLRRRRVS